MSCGSEFQEFGPCRQNSRPICNSNSNATVTRPNWPCSSVEGICFCFLVAQDGGSNSCACLYCSDAGANERVGVRRDTGRLQGGSRQGTCSWDGHVRLERVGRSDGELSNVRLGESYLRRLGSRLRWSTHWTLLQLVRRDRYIDIDGNKTLCCHRRTALRNVLVKILPTAAQQQLFYYMFLGQLLVFLSDIAILLF